jgi:ankyrin repeat protein
MKKSLFAGIISMLLFACVSTSPYERVAPVVRSQDNAAIVKALAGWSEEEKNAALLLAIEKRDLETARLLLDHGVNPKYQKKAYIKIVRDKPFPGAVKLVSQGTYYGSGGQQVFVKNTSYELDKRDDRGETPLSKALNPLWKNGIVMIRLLLDHGADPRQAFWDSGSEEFVTPVDYARKHCPEFLPTLEGK